MERFQEFMTRRIYGVPVGLLVALVAAAMLYAALKMRPSADPVMEDASSDDVPEGDADANEVSNTTFSASPSTPTVVAIATEDSNTLWGKRVRDYLITVGAPAATAERVVSRYLAGDSLTSSERAWIDKGIAQYGFPPEDVPLAPDDVEDDLSGTVTDGDDVSDAPSVPPVTGGTAPPSTQGVPPTRHTVKNGRDNGAGELARIYYGSNAPAKVVKIRAANVDEKGSDPWAVGTRIYIPKDKQPEWFVATKAVHGLGDIAAKNGKSRQFIQALNPEKSFPVTPGTRVRVE